jgi:hypothetical protein
MVFGPIRADMQLPAKPTDRRGDALPRQGLGPLGLRASTMLECTLNCPLVTFISIAEHEGETIERFTK